MSRSIIRQKRLSKDIHLLLQSSVLQAPLMILRHQHGFSQTAELVFSLCHIYHEMSPMLLQGCLPEK